MANEPICADCAKQQGLVPKDKQVGMWQAECYYCGEVKTVCDRTHDYREVGK
jgi:hypothetical protein